jgi:8-oxo-dGTP diphosphatase
MSKETGVGVILINVMEEVLLILRDNNPAIPFPGKWDLPGGHPEGNETPEKTIRREIQEEMEIDLTGFDLFNAYEWDDFREIIFWKKLNLIPEQITLHEGQKLAYFSRRQINSMDLAFHNNRVLEDFFEFYELISGTEK